MRLSMEAFLPPLLDAMRLPLSPKNNGSSFDRSRLFLCRAWKADPKSRAGWLLGSVSVPPPPPPPLPPLPPPPLAAATASRR